MENTKINEKDNIIQKNNNEINLLIKDLIRNRIKWNFKY